MYYACIHCGVKNVMTIAKTKKVHLCCKKYGKKHRCLWNKCTVCGDIFVTNSKIVKCCSEKCSISNKKKVCRKHYEAKFDRSIYKYVLERDNYSCKRCHSKKKYGRIGLHVHHVIPKSLGGTDEYDNLITICAGCHITIHKYPDSNKNFIKITNDI